MTHLKKDVCPHKELKTEKHFCKYYFNFLIFFSFTIESHFVGITHKYRPMAKNGKRQEQNVNDRFWADMSVLNF